MNYLLVNAERGWVRLQPFSGYGGIKGETSQGPLNFPEINQQAAQMDEVALCIKENRPMRVPGEEGLKDIKVVEAIFRSIQAGGARISLT